MERTLCLAVICNRLSEIEVGGCLGHDQESESGSRASPATRSLPSPGSPTPGLPLTLKYGLFGFGIALAGPFAREPLTAGAKRLARQLRDHQTIASGVTGTVAESPPAHHECRDNHFLLVSKLLKPDRGRLVPKRRICIQSGIPNRVGCCGSQAGSGTRKEPGPRRAWAIWAEAHKTGSSIPPLEK